MTSEYEIDSFTITDLPKRTEQFKVKMAEELQVYEFKDGRYLREFWGRCVSKVWKYFKFEVTCTGDYVDKSVLYCQMCNTKMKYCGNTTNMANHLLRKHPQLRGGGWNVVARHSLDEDVHVKQEAWEMDSHIADTAEYSKSFNEPNILDQIKVENFEMTENGNMTILKSFWGDCSDKVWDYFKFEVDGEGKYCNKEESVCTLCECRLYYFGDIVTLQAHLDTEHQDLRCPAPANDDSAETPIVSTREEEYVKRMVSMCAKAAQDDHTKPAPLAVITPSPGHPLYKPFWGNATSIVWDHFKFEADENGGYVNKEVVHCQHCDTKLKYCHNTTNMGYHLQRWHQIPRSSSVDSPYAAANRRSNENMSTLDKPGEKHSQIQEKIIPSGKRHTEVVKNLLKRRLVEDGAESIAGESRTMKYSDDCNFRIWQYFRFLSNEKGHPLDTNGVYCTLCEVRLTYNLTFMKQHFRQCHFDIFSEVVLSDGEVPKQKLCKDLPILQSIADHFIADLRPVGDIDSPSFRKMCLAMHPKLMLPHEQMFKQDVLMPIYVQQKEECMLEISKASQHSLTMDWWKSNSNQKFVTITIHFVSEQWQLVSKVIRTWHISKHPTPQTLASKLSTLQFDWRLKDLVIVTDDSYVMSEAVNILSWPSVSAVDHCVDLAVKRVFSMAFVQDILTKVRSIFAKLHEVADKVQVKHNQIQLNLPQRDLLQDFDESQWTQTLGMLVLFVEQWPLLKSAIVDCKLNDDLIIPPKALEDLQNDLIETLEVFKVATAYMSPTRQHPVSVLMPMLIKLKKSLKISDSDSKLKREVKQTMSEVIEERYKDEDVQMLLKKASALDPRMKKLHFLSQFEQRNVRKTLYNEATSLAKENTAPDKLTDDESSEHSGEEDGETQAKVARMAEPSMSDWLGDIVSVKGNMSLGEKVETEMKRFLCEPDLQFEQSPIKWWRDRFKMYPLLSPLARRYMCIPAIGVEMGANIQAKRKCLQTDTAHMQLFLQQLQ